LRFLSTKGIQESEISQRFEDVEKFIIQLFGTGGRLMLTGALTKLCDEYSLGFDLPYGTPFHVKLSQIRERVLVDKLSPRHYRRSIDTTSFEDKSGATAAWTG
jgi:hypothetical protein